MRFGWTCAALALASCASAQGEAIDTKKQGEKKVGEATERAHPVAADKRWLTYRGAEGLPGARKHIVLIAAEQEYRSEESLPMLARVLAKHHGFDTTVLFSLNEDGHVDPTQESNGCGKDVQHDIPGLEHLARADAVVFSTRFMTLPAEQLARIISYLDSGKPILGIRTAKHGFSGPFPYKIGKRRVRFGDDVLGGAFRGHYGGWHREGTRGILVDAQREHPILRGVCDIFGTSDVYRMYPKGKSLPKTCTALVLGQPLKGLNPDDEPNEAKPPLPVAWTNTWTTSKRAQARVFHVTMGSARDFRSEGLRRLFVNAVYWSLGLEASIDATRSVEPTKPYAPRKSGFNYEKLDVRPRPPRAFS